MFIGFRLFENSLLVNENFAELFLGVGILDLSGILYHGWADGT